MNDKNKDQQNEKYKRVASPRHSGRRQNDDENGIPSNRHQPEQAKMWQSFPQHHGLFPPSSQRLEAALLELEASKAAMEEFRKKALEALEQNPTERESHSSGTELHGSSSSHGVRRIPCSARGVAADHNSDTAYFLVSNSTNHGDDLLCSHQSCKNRGIRFLYCATCRGPAAKGNFSTRHNHEDGEGSGDETTGRNSSRLKKVSEPPKQTFFYVKPPVPGISPQQASVILAKASEKRWDSFLQPACDNSEISLPTDINSYDEQKISERIPAEELPGSGPAVSDHLIRTIMMSQGVVIPAASSYPDLLRQQTGMTNNPWDAGRFQKDNGIDQPKKETSKIENESHTKIQVSPSALFSSQQKSGQRKSIPLTVSTTTNVDNQQSLEEGSTDRSFSAENWQPPLHHEASIRHGALVADQEDEATTDIPSRKRQRKWMKLLVRRPPVTEREAMVKWMEQVIHTSDQSIWSSSPSPSSSRGSPPCVPPPSPPSRKRRPKL